ncbi:fatty acid desaturase [bacterium]|nr:fatty acid desaturase [bacterium]
MHDSQRAYRWRGVFIAAIILLSWCSAIVYALSADLSSMLWLAFPLVPLITFLYTGLFITAHDAMHGTVAPAHPALNAGIGRLATALYALFSFSMLRRKHAEHHAHPASADDPDFHDGRHPSLLRWYVHFFFTYVTWKQLLGMALLYNALKYLAGVPDLNLLLFWVLPALLSTFQLFYFGTYLPHREGDEPYREPHRARSNAYGVTLSFLTCYHFGYHEEHHIHPGIPWWRLPGYRRQLVQPNY